MKQDLSEDKMTLVTLVSNHQKITDEPEGETTPHEGISESTEQSGVGAEITSARRTRIKRNNF